MKKQIIKVATLNLQSGIGVTKGYWQYPLFAWKYLFPHSLGKIKEAGDFIRDEGIDILVLNEADAGSLRSVYQNQADLISRKAGFKQKIFFPTYRFFPFFSAENAILSKHNIIDSEQIRLPGAGEPRYLGKATLNFFGRKIHVFVSHLSLGRKKREKQIQEISNILKKVKGPVILMGDFNAVNGELKPLQEKGFKYANKCPTYPSWNPKICIDHILIRNLSIKCSHSYKSKLFSDHLLLIAEIYV
jgi:endonuclease/exonuclease/phosphatase family metal-dependent hydrolase